MCNLNSLAAGSLWPQAPGAGAEGQILGFDLAQVRLDRPRPGGRPCPGAMLAHLEKTHDLAQVAAQLLS